MRGSPAPSWSILQFNVAPEILTFIARSVTNNGRDLEGALNRLLAHQHADRGAGYDGTG